MNASSGSFQRFLGRVHRRFVLVRALERAGLGFLGGCAIGLPLLAIAIWRGLSAESLALTAGCVGTATGLLWGCITRPSRLAAAMEADRQLKSADLLSSAMAASARADDPWAAAVVAAADRWAALHSPSAVLLNRLGARTWGGIGLAAALLAAIALLPIYASPSNAGQDGTSLVNLLPDESASSISGKTSPGSRARRSPAQQEPEDVHPGRIAAADHDAAPQNENSSQFSDTPDRRSGAMIGNAQGTGESHSQANHQQRLDKPEKATSGLNDSAGGSTAAGLGRGVDRPRGRGAASGDVAGAADASSQIPPWNSPHWLSDVEHARQAVQSGQVPDEYRDMIRGYFDRAKAR